MDAVVLTSKNGIPIASFLEKQEKSESFSALSATILGASEVIFSSFGKNDPKVIEVSAGDSLLLITGVDKNSVLSSLGEVEAKESIKNKLIDLATEIVEVKKSKS